MNSKLPTITAQTFTPFYSQTEDRIRLVVNYADYPNRFDLWLTRAFLLQLLPTLEECIDTHGVQGEKSELQKATEQQAQKQTDSSTLSVTEKEGHLVHSVDITYRPDNQYFEIIFKTEGANVMAILNETLLTSVLKSIFNAIPHIAWGISHQLIR